MKGSLIGYFSEPQVTKCSNMWGAPLLLSGKVLKVMTKRSLNLSLLCLTLLIISTKCFILDLKNTEEYCFKTNNVFHPSKNFNMIVLCTFDDAEENSHVRIRMWQEKEAA